MALLLAILVYRLVGSDSSRGARLIGSIRADRRPPAPAFRLGVLWPRPETWPVALRPVVGRGKVSPAALLGHPLVVNFWASWCVPCKEETPRLVRAASARSGNITFLGVDVEDASSDARSFLRRYHVNYVAVHDGGESTVVAYGLVGLPETFFVDARGRIVAHVVGKLSAAALDEGLRRIAA